MRRIMTITTRRGSRLSLLAAFLLLCSAPAVFAAQPWHFPGGTAAAHLHAADEPQPTVFRLDDPKRLDVIVEFQAAPLLEARRTKDVHLAAIGLDALTARFAKDLARIDGEAKPRIAAQAVEASAIRYTYRMAFAGAGATVNRESLPALRALPYVRAVRETRRMEAQLAQSVPHIGAPEVWKQYGRRGKGVVVAIVDTGVDYRHWALGEGFGPGFKVAGGYDFVNNDADPMDDYGHGTHVAGIVAANHKYLTGVAPEATLLAYKVLDNEGFGTDAMVLAGVERALDPNNDGDPSDHADIVNMSLGGPTSYDDPLVAAVERGTAAGVVFCISAGNNNQIATIGSPGVALSAITVGATDIDDKLASFFSSGGPLGGTWAVKPEVVAPGVNIASAYPGGRTFVASGTSMAAPHVSGLAALLLEEHPDWTPADVKAAMVSTAKPIFERNRPVISLVFAGGGRIDALRAIGATILPSPATAAFGLVRTTDQPWTATTTVKLTNHGTAAETLTLRRPLVPSGATLTVVPETVTLAPGATEELKLTLDVLGHAQPNDSDIVFSGILELTGSRSPVQVPWMLIKSDVLTATYSGSEDFLMYLSDGQNRAAAWAEGPRTFGAFVPRLLASDILVLTQGSDTKLIIRERQQVEGYTEVTIHPEDAAYTLRVDGVDERGLPLNSLNPEDPGLLEHDLTLPSLSIIKLLHEGGRRSLRVSAMKYTRIQTYETIVAGSDHYFAAYRHLRGVKQDETLSIRPSDWASQKIRHLCRTDCTASIGAGDGSPVYYLLHPLTPSPDPWTIHITPGVSQQYDFRAYLRVREKGLVINDESVNPWTFLSGSIRNVNGRIATSPLGRATKVDYSAPDRETPLVLGEGPVVLRIAAGLYAIQLDPYGQLGELLGDNARNIDATLQKTDGGSAGLIPQDWKGWYETNRAIGTFRLVTTDDYFVAGREGRLTQTSLYDNRATPDGPPTLTTLRVESGLGVATSTVAAQSRPRLLFSARQSTIGQVSFMVSHGPVVPAATRAWWRRHGTTDWLPLSVSLTGEDFEYPSDFYGAPGMLFAAPLGDAVTAEGEIDLKIFVRNELGGTTEAVYEPAFVVGPPGGARRRVVR
jgi:hypothetical protein